MDLKTFQAPTMSQALAEVKSALGPGAIILHTRTFKRHKWLGLRRKNVVEITAGRDTGQHKMVRRNLQSQSSSALAKTRPPSSPIAMPAKTRTDFRHELLQSPAAQGAAVVGLTQEINNLRGMVKELVDFTRQQQCPQVPEELIGFYSQLIQNQVAAELAQGIIKSLQQQIRPEHARQPDFVREKIADHIDRLLPKSSPIVRTKRDGPHVVALVGPTGVGKTTTIAKLAANLKVREKRGVGLVTIDTYRIAAVDQLKKYADILGSPLRVVSSPEDMQEALHSMREFEYILIDTAGRSPNDTLKLNELKSFLAAANPDEVHLVLSSTASQLCVELAISRFADVRTDKVIFTKLDEAAHVGVVLNVLHKLNKSLSYVTTGQDVPKDIEVGRGRRLARMILGMDA
jgi:flagellar biosynthesis protein FlhF